MFTAPGTRALTRVVNEDILRGPKRLLFWTLSMVGLATIGLFFFSWFQLPAWGEHPFVMVILLAFISVLLINHLARWWVLPSMKRPRAMPAQAGLKVAVVTTFVPGLEPLDLLEQTLKALVSLDYPHDTWVLDEGSDDRVKQTCAALGAIHFTRLHYPHYQTEIGRFRTGSKHGNYNAWLHEVGFERYDIMAAFDPDHVPERIFLSKVLGYFEDPAIGYVQAPQVYANQQASVIARGAAEETYEFSSSVQMACYGKGLPLIIGCHNTHRLSALRECGGFASHDADDLLLTILYQDRGWCGVYVPEILARGLAPVDWSTYLSQQRRWTRSVLDIKLRIAPSIVRNFSLTARMINVFHGLNYVHRGIVLPAAMTLVALMLLFDDMPEVATRETLLSGGLTLVMLQIWERYRQRFYLGGPSERGMHWRAGLVQFAKWPYQLAAFTDVVFNRQFPYVATSKMVGPSRSSSALWPHMITIAVMGMAWGIGIMIHGTLPVTIQVCAGVAMALTVGLLITEWLGR